MSSILNKITVIDLETTCWENEPVYQKEHAEITEIGCCILDLTKNIISKPKSFYVLPDSLKLEKNGVDFPNPVISDYCIKLTGIDDDLLLSKGKPFPEVINSIKKEYPVSKIWGSWGNFDKKQLKKECAIYSVSFPFNENNYFDIKMLFALLTGRKNSISLVKALRSLNIVFEGKHHCGKDDAINTAKILQKILKKC